MAEIGFTAFVSLAKNKQATARLIVRRVPDVNPANQHPLFTVYRHHAVFTNSPLPMLEAEKTHGGHAVVEQIIADLKNGPVAHLPEVISSWLVDHGCDLGVASWTVSARRDCRVAGQHGPISSELVLLGVSHRPLGTRIADVRWSPSAWARALRSSLLSRSRWRIRWVAASRRRSREVSEAHCR